MKDGETIDFGCYGKARVTTLRNDNQKMGESFWRNLSRELEMKDVLSKLPASTTDYICNEDNHKFTLTFWKAILDWQEHSPGPETSKYIELLEETIQKYLTWNFADQNTFKILKFLAAGILRLLKHGVSAECQPTILTLLFTLYTTGSDVEPAANFISIFRTSLEKFLHYDTDLQSNRGNNGSSESDTDVVYLLSLLARNRVADVGGVFTLLHRAQTWAARPLVVYPSGKSSQPVSLIHYTIFKLSGMCTHIKTSSDLRTMETVLFQNTLSYCALVYLVSSTVLVFLVRLAGPQYISSLLHLLCSLLSQTQCLIRARNLRALLSRLLPFSDTNLQSQIQTRLDSDSCGLLELCTEVPKRNKIANDFLMKWNSSNLKTDVLIKAIPSCTTLLPLLHEVSRSLCQTFRRPDTLCKLDNMYNVVVTLLQSVVMNWKCYRADVIKLFQVLAKILPLEDILLSSLILDVFVRYSSFKSGDPVKYCEACTTLIAKLVNSQDLYISFKCLLAVATFAKMTPHPEVLTSLAKDPVVKTKLSNFFQKPISPSGKYITPKPTRDIDLQVIMSISPGERLILNEAINSIGNMKIIPLYSARQLQEIVSRKANLQSQEHERFLKGPE